MHIGFAFLETWQIPGRLGIYVSPSATWQTPICRVPLHRHGARRPRHHAARALRPLPAARVAARRAPVLYHHARRCTRRAPAPPAPGLAGVPATTTFSPFSNVQNMLQ